MIFRNIFLRFKIKSRTFFEVKNPSGLSLFLGFAFFIINQNPTQAQSPQLQEDPFYINYTTDDGLPSSECHHTIQDQKGYIWIATDNGVSRFDGYKFRNFSAEEGLKNNVVFYLQEDKKGQVWMLTMSGNLYYYSYQTDQIHPFRHNDKILQFQGKYDWAGPFYIDSLNTVYVGLKNFGIIRIEESGAIFLYQTEELASTIAVETEDNIVYAKIDCPFKRAEKCNQRYLGKGLTQPWEFYQDTILVRKVLAKRNDLIFSKNRLISTKIKGASDICKKLKNGQILGQFSYSNYFFEKDFSYSSRKQFIRIGSEKTVLELPNGNLLIGELNPGGTYIFENNADFVENRFKFKFLKNRQISSIQKDENDGIWMTTTKSGLFYFPNFINNTNKILLPNTNVSGFSIDKESKVFIGEGKKRLHQFNLKNNEFSPVIPYQRAGPIRTIFNDKKNEALWVASGNLSWLENEIWYDLAKTVENTTFLRLGISKKFNISQNQKYLWAWHGQVFYKIDLTTKSLIFDSEKFNIRTQINCVFEDKSETLWVGNNIGLFKLQNDSLRLQTQHPSFNIRIEDIRQMEDSTLVIGTKGGGILFYKDADIIQVTTKNGLTSNLIENIYVDSLNRVWAGTSEGLNLIRLDGNRQVFARSFTQKHGLPSNEINQVEAKGNDVWVATSKGLIKLPDWKTDTLSPLPMIEKILVNGQYFQDSDNQKIELNYDQNSIQIEFLTIDFNQFGDIQYRYRFAPSYSDWVYTKNRRLDFSALNDDNYVLEIQSQNRDGFWSESTSLKFSILPPFWKTWWFILISFLVVAGAIGIWIYYREKGIQREANLVKQMAEAEQFALRSQMNPHFVFNCLASIQGFIK